MFVALNRRAEYVLPGMTTMTTPESPVEAIFSAALSKQSPEVRAAYLDEVCRGEPELRRRVERLLEAHPKLGGFLEGGLTEPEASRDGPPIHESPDTMIGPYKLLEQIGEGGMGTVYLAEQTVPVKRMVALKVIKAGMDGRQVLARFGAERQALALMDHPNIARVLDAGATDTGRPFFVMELVKGLPITQFCDERLLTPRERLELFIPVCQAVQHAHQKGIIHRDLKPSNVVVGLYDGKPVPKIIDFGVAKATGAKLTEATLYTGFGQVVGTPEYMSPEQAQLDNIDIDTRSDIYSLGVLLYELLTGTTPLRRSQAQTTALFEVLRIIREEDPPWPSTRLSTTEELPTIAANRGLEPRKLMGIVRGELDWIVMKALDKDRNRRYESASSLARDVQRYLADEPVQASPPSRWYKLRKLVWRNKGTFASALAVALLSLLSIITLGVGNSRIRWEQRRTKQEKDRAEKAQELAESRADEIRRGLERLKAANALLDRGRHYAWGRNWDDAHQAFSQAIELHPDHVSVWAERGDLYTRLGLWDLAAADYAREMELREPEMTIRWYQHALLRHAIGDLEGCRLAGRAMRERFAGTLEVSFCEETLRSSLLVADPAVDLSELIYMAREAVPQRLCSMPYVLGAAHYRAGQYEEAIQRLQKWVGQPHWPIGFLGYPVLAMAHHRLGHQTEARHALDEAARLLDRWTRERYTACGENWAIRAGGDADWPVPWWDYLECQLLYAEARGLIDGASPPDDPRLHVLRARGFAGLDWMEQAAAEFDAALRLSPQDPQIRLEAHHYRGRLYVDRHRWRDAAAEFTKATELRPDDARFWRFRAVAQFAEGDCDAHRQTCMAMLERFGRTEDRFAAGNVLLACVLRDDALPDMKRLLPLTRVSDALWHWGAGVRGAALYRAGRYEECVQSFESATRKYRPRAWDWCFLAMARHRLRDDDEARRCLSEAKRWIDAANHHTGDDPSGTQPVWGGWHEPVIAALLVREAEELLNARP
jgi:serine/threonine protein kinase/Flp pilus assembly protein TadD